MIDRNSRLPIYVQIENYFLKEIEEGRLRAGDLFPSETVLSRELGVSRMTIRQAVNNLVLNGYLERSRGKGTFILERNPDKIELPLDKLRNFSKEVQKSGKAAKNTVVEFKLVEASSGIAEILRIKPGEKVYYMERVRCLEDTPAVLEQTYMRYDLFEDLTEEVIKSSKYKYIREKGLEIKESKREILAEVPLGNVASLLKLKRNEPVLKAKSITYLKDGTPFEYSEISYNQNKYKFTLVAEYD